MKNRVRQDGVLRGDSRFLMELSHSSYDRGSLPRPLSMPLPFPYTYFGRMLEHLTIFSVVVDLTGGGNRRLAPRVLQCTTRLWRAHPNGHLPHGVENWSADSIPVASTLSNSGSKAG